ncbi:MAG: NCS2 family permease [Treponema sp.]|jgi:AGZA family xanthine/uracil permease-like MFS transporter|nr:NCS2 family permease [Treponema sp.]
MDKFFGISNSGSSVRTEILAGFTTFFTMAYIMFVNPSLLSETGMSWSGVFVATVIAAAVGTLVMGLAANVPYAVAPGMGMNAFFTYTVCFGIGFKWQEALAIVFICGIINIIITVTKLRKAIIMAIPKSLQLAIGGGIGLYIAYIGLINGGIIQFGAVPTLTHFNEITMEGVRNLDPILAVTGLVITIVLLMLKVKGALLIGIIAATLIGIPMGITQIPEKIFTTGVLSGIKDVSFAFFGEVGLKSLFSDGRAYIALITIFAFSLTDTFDTIGTFIGTGRKSGIFDFNDEKAHIKGFKTKMDKALFADATATSVGALFGTSNTTTYIESASGISEGGRTGFTSVIVAVLFLICIPLVSIFGMAPSAATSPILIIVGVLMAESFAGINWKELDEAIPAFFTVMIMIFAYNISYGIAFGFISYCIVKVCKKQVKEVNPIMFGAALLFIFYFVLMAVNHL